ncbi:hypothetical protein DICSQDRAFT_164146 [Dichomitus squalens LYAD-421 SS1]|uniref:FAM72 protein-domain-containing protein n=1 Tax=Dichomitus squalens (strain LYAD-421) TaxID=732165 RepID=R7SJ99_DICSQ|nr:uncharacterized protein DICSQDRAFT_164146 [Dichomitus squalens LYAD-421 SS1]EJF55790.1 hypothetical protein DICSQDRAFT_164146 [Dichomitus squalens LYAD-421 SS1]
MPARTVPSSPDLALSPPRFHPRPTLQPLSSSHLHRDALDERSPEYNTYAVRMPPQNAHPDADYGSHPGWPPPGPRVYPDPSSIPPHWHVHPSALTQYRDARTPAPPAPATQSNARAPWQNPYTRVLQVQPFVAPPPPPIPHKVWILDCKACGMFLTNRGMKAVLLLRPNVPLYSTDALPINCSAFSPESEGTIRMHSTSVSSTSSGSGSRSARSSISGPSGDPAQPNASAERSPTRTCECLTQTLCCHGCGNAVGYMIVSPCQRCTSSITVNNRATNGHRFVFYSSEITACERHYISGERGVSPFHPLTSPNPQTLQSGMAGLTIGNSSPRQSVAQQPTPASSTPSTPHSMPPLSPGLTISPGSTIAARRTSVDYLPTPPPDAESAFAPNARVGPTPATAASINTRPSAISSASRSPTSSQSRSRANDDAGPVTPPAPPNSHSTSPHTGNTPPATGASSPTLPPSARARAASTSAAAPSPASAYPPPLNVYNIVPAYLSRPLHPPAPPPAPPPEPLKAGEVLYWHHLLRSGEIPAVSEDPRARLDEGDADVKNEAAMRNALPSGIVAGR